MATPHASKVRMRGNEVLGTNDANDHSRSRWAIVLAAGNGTRLRALTTLDRGVSVPKQFCSLHGGPSLLRHAVDRASKVVRRDRILVVVAEGHRQWWEAELADLPAANIVVQPGNRGTAAGILLPLLVLLRRDPDPQLLVVPSDHFVAEESVLTASADRALERVRERDRIVLLGISPERAESGFGWIVPGRSRRAGLKAVSKFVEKPDRQSAARLMRRGAVWNSFLFSARGLHLLDCFRSHLPELTRALDGIVDARINVPSSRLRKTYASLPTLDFSRDLLERAAASLEVVTVPGCGWNDLGTPDRVADCLRRTDPPRRMWNQRTRLSVAPLDLGMAQQRLASGP